MNQSDLELAEKRLSDRFWRMNNLYHIIDKQGQKRKFELNWAQREIYDDLHYLNIILKSRQLGITTFITLLFLDVALFNSNVSCGIIADTEENAKYIFRKIKFAYDCLPEQLKSIREAKIDSAKELTFSNNSLIRVGTSLRSATFQYLLISEYGKIAVDDIKRANEILTGSLNTIAIGSYCFIESTARGRSGVFYDMCIEAKKLQDAGKSLTKMDYRFHFLPWWKESHYRISQGGIHISDELEEYFNLLALQDIKLDHEQKCWYAAKFSNQGENMRREFPSCICIDTPVLTKNGIFKIQDAPVDGNFILDKFYKGQKEVYEVTTSLGYSIKSTIDHLFLSEGKFKRLEEMDVGSSITLDGGDFGKEIITVEYNVNKFTKGKIEITSDFARFIGYFMGDGSFYKNVISIAIDAQDQDVVEDVENLLNEFIGESQRRTVGEKKGCIELRVSRINIVESFYALDLIRRNSSRSFKRKINVPWYIKQSPKEVVRQFLIGLFEADGYAKKNGSDVKFFAKDIEFMKDVSLLLLQFGITAKISTKIRKMPNGGECFGNEMVLRKKECEKFKQEIGFFSERKNGRLSNFKDIPHYNLKGIDFKDTIASIKKIGITDVYDLTTSTHQFSAGGIVVHNCPEECWQVSNEGLYYGKQITQARLEKRIGHIPYDESLPVFTAWDLGYNDQTSIWFVQYYGKEIRLIDYLEGSGESLAYWLGIVKSKPYVYEKHLAPHDVMVHEYSSGMTRQASARKMGINLLPVKKVELIPGIDQVRGILPRCFFDERKCEKGIKALENYKKEWNDRAGCWNSSPLHNWASHGADAFRVLATGLHYIEKKENVDAHTLSYNPLAHKQNRFSFGRQSIFS